tara:strand:- start:439 stop:621 length:183 start_codon:yes stop_codon:yes gene_type:complete
MLFLKLLAVHFSGRGVSGSDVIFEVTSRDETFRLAWASSIALSPVYGGSIGFLRTEGSTN